MNLKNNYNFTFYFVLYITLLFGLFLNEDLTTGYKADHFIHLHIIERFEQNFTQSLLNFNRKDLEFSTSHSPFFYVFYLLIKKISLNNDFILRIINLHISLFIPYLFYLILKNKNLTNKNALLIFIPGIFFLSPYFRSGSFWIGSENISIVFLFASFYYYLLFKNVNNKKFSLIILHVLFFSIAAYFRPIYSIFSLFFFISLFRELMATKKIFHYIMINLFLTLPAFYYIFILKINFIAMHIVSDPISITRFTNQFSIVVSILFFYSIIFLVFNFKKIVKASFNFTNVLFFFIYIFILINYFNYIIPYGGGIFYRISTLFFSNNYFFYFFSGLGFIFIKIILIDNFKPKQNINDIILFLTLLFFEIDRTIYHETYDIIIYPIFLIFFKNYYFSNFLENFTKNKLIFLYCFSSLFLLMNFIKLFVY